LFCVLFVCNCVLYCTVLYCTVLYYCHRMSTQLQLNISISMFTDPLAFTKHTLGAAGLDAVNHRRFSLQVLTLILLTLRIWWTPNNASRWQMGFNSAFKGLNTGDTKKRELLNCVVAAIYSWQHCGTGTLSYRQPRHHFSNHGSVERSTECFRHKNILQKQW